MLQRQVFFLLFLTCLSCGTDEDPIFDSNEGFSKIVICHSIGNGQFVKTFISETELDAHISHGDGFPMECHKPSLMFMGVECNLYEIYHRNKCEE